MSKDLLDESTVEAMRQRIFKRYQEPMDEDTIEVLMTDLLTTYGRFSRLCNMLILQPKGLGSGVIDALHDVKCNMSRVKYYMEQRDKPVMRHNADAIRLLAEQHKDDTGPVGDAARALLEAVPIGSET